MIFLLGLCSSYLSAITPNDERWNVFVKSHPGDNVLPEDEKIGILANLQDPDPAWADALMQCEAVFETMEKGVIDSDKLFFAPTKFMLEMAFNEVLKRGPLKGKRRYGIPKRNGDRISIPIRLEGKTKSNFGHIYLVLEDQQWFIEHWALDLSDMESAGAEEKTEEPSDSDIEDKTEESPDPNIEEYFEELPDSEMSDVTI